MTFLKKVDNNFYCNITFHENYMPEETFQAIMYDLRVNFLYEEGRYIGQTNEWKDGCKWRF